MSERKGTRALELWCKRLVRDCPDVQIDNMTTSWRNGIAFCALVHHFRPDLIDMSTLKPENIYDNNQLAFSIAEKHLGIPSLLDPEDMVANDVPDRLSVLTYLSQFYQRLGHTVNTKASETESSSPSSTIQSTAPIKFGKTGLDKCAACGLPVYLAQRLIVSHKLYHRRCFRCSKCFGHLNPKNFEFTEGSDLFCDSCKNEKTLSKLINNNDQMGMLAFSDDFSETPDGQYGDPISPKLRSKPQSILEKISMFEDMEKDKYMENKLSTLSLTDNLNNKTNEIGRLSVVNKSETQSGTSGIISTEMEVKTTENTNLTLEHESSLYKNIPETVYKSNIDKFSFLQTQLTGEPMADNADIKTLDDNDDVVIPKQNKENDISVEDISEANTINDCSNIVLKEENNITDDIRIFKSHSTSPNIDSCTLETSELSKSEHEINISVPPRRKKHLNLLEKVSDIVPVSDVVLKQDLTNKSDSKQYPDNLNPFSDDDEEVDSQEKRVSTNPFGSSDEEADYVPPMKPPSKFPTGLTTSPGKRLIAAQNPFWSDGEEPSSDEEIHDGKNGRSMYSSMATSTPNLLPGDTPRRHKKTRAPPPPVITVQQHLEHPSTSMDDVASISSLSSYNSTVHSDQKSFGKSSPRLSKKRVAPTPPESLSALSGTAAGCGSLEADLDSADLRGNTSDAGRRTKGPAPGLPLPERREVKLQLPPEELQVQLDLLETQQLGLERQGVLIEQMIRDKCEGDEASASAVPQEEVEDLVIQLCELVNEKNDLFRKQTELMYIRRQQRLEQEQADIEHEIRVIQSRPAVNRIDADKAREEQLVSRLVQIVRMRDELVQQIDAERRRERQEDIAIAASIASKRAQRNSESNSSSMKSVEVVATPKKSKVREKVKKQLKKAKHTLISKKKEDSGDRKDDKTEKEKKHK